MKRRITSFFQRYCKMASNSTRIQFDSEISGDGETPMFSIRRNEIYRRGHYGIQFSFFRRKVYIHLQGMLLLPFCMCFCLVERLFFVFEFVLLQFTTLRALSVIRGIVWWLCRQWRHHDPIYIGQGHKRRSSPRSQSRSDARSYQSQGQGQTKVKNKVIKFKVIL